MLVIQSRFCRVDDGVTSLLKVRTHVEEHVFFTLERTSNGLPIKSGRYELRIKEELTPLTERYRKAYPWFDKHIEITGVTGRTDVYFHIGNKPEDSDACVLVGSTADIWSAFVGNSTKAFKHFYSLIYPQLKSGKPVFLEIFD